MTDQQTYLTLEQAALPAKVEELKNAGYRIVQIGATKLADHLELNYSFDLEYKFVNFQLRLPLSGGVIKSISAVYPAAFLYENEIHDLFGVTIEGLPIDYRGNFYRKARQTPFNTAAAGSAGEGSQNG